MTSISVVLMHSYAFPNHELKIKEIALKIGFK
ncbi:MAG: hydantoinase/oxoprolinase N-terminal domain-containing protein [Flammeovirgaceae bacterium]